MKRAAVYKRVLIKISGEALMGDQEFGVDKKATSKIAKMLSDLIDEGIQVAIVIGGGNIFRGVQQGPTLGIERVAADQIGMIATLINGITLEQALKAEGVAVRTMSALDCPAVAEKYQWEKAMRYLDKGIALLFVGGTGHPYFTTDTTAALRACEIGADIFLKATLHVDGVYNKDPRRFKDAKKYKEISYKEALDEKLGAFDLTAVTLCMTNQIPIKVFNIFGGSFLDVLVNKNIGTLVRNPPQK